MPSAGFFVLVILLILSVILTINIKQTKPSSQLFRNSKILLAILVGLTAMPSTAFAATLFPNFDDGRLMSTTSYMDSLGSSYAISTGEHPTPVYANTWNVEPTPGEGQVLAQKYNDGGILRWHNSALPDFVSQVTTSVNDSVSLLQDPRGNDTIIVVAASYESTGAVIDNVNFDNGDVFGATRACMAAEGNFYTEIWYIENPSNDAGYVNVNWEDGIDAAYVKSVSFLNVDKSGGALRDTVCTNSTGTTQEMVVEGTQAYDRVFGLVTASNSPANSITPYWQDIDYWDGNLGRVGASNYWNETRPEFVSAGSLTTVYDHFNTDYTLRWSQSEANQWSGAAIVIKGLDVSGSQPNLLVYQPDGNYHNIRSFSADNDGQYGYVMAWTAYDSGFDSDYDVYVQKVDRFGIPLWHANGAEGGRPYMLATGLTGDPESISVKADSDGNAIVAYEESAGIRSAKVTSDGSTWVGELILPYTGTDSGYDYLSLVTSDKENFVVAAFDPDFDGSNSSRIFAQKFTTNDQSSQWNSGDPLSVAPNTDILDESIIVAPGNDGGAAFALNADNGELRLKYITGNGDDLWGTDGTLVHANGYAQGDHHSPENTLQYINGHWFLAYKVGYSDLYRLNIEQGDPYTVISNTLIDTDIGLFGIMTDGGYNSVLVYYKDSEIYATSVDGLGDLRIPQNKVIFDLPIQSISIGMMQAISNREYNLILKRGTDTDWEFYFQRFIHVHNIIQLDSDLGALTDWNVDVSLNGDQGWIESNLGIKLKDKLENALIAQVNMNLEDDRNWGGVSGQTSLSEFKSVVSGLGSAPGVLGTHSLYIPYSSAHNFVHICPTATTLVQVTAECAGGYNVRESDPQVEIVNIDGIDYWRVDGLSGTGGIGVSLQDGIQFNLIPNYSAVSATQEVVAEYAPTSEFNPGDQIAIDFDTGGDFTLANTCAVPTNDADADGTPDGSATVMTNGGPNVDRFVYTFSAPTTLTTTNGISLCMNVTSPTIAANYRVDLADQLGNFGSTFYYVGSENTLNVIGHVDPVLTMVVRTADDTADQGNLLGAIGPNICNLGNLSDTGVQSCSYRLKVTTNAGFGYSINVQTDGDLRKGTDAIDNVAEDSTNVVPGAEGYGVQVSAGQITSGTIAANAPFDDNDSPLGNGTNTILVNATGPNNPLPVDVDNTTLVTHVAEANSSTPAGTYTQLVTYTVSASF